MSEPKNWAVVHDGAAKYVGVCAIENIEVGVMHLTEAFELVMLRMPQQAPGGRGVAIAVVVNPMPIGLASGQTTIHVRPSAVELFREMDARDRATYEKLVEDARQSFLARRAEASGIALATNIPKG